MTRLQWSQIVDGLATQDPARLGYGYADTQYPWHHDAAFDFCRMAMLGLVEQVAASARGRGTVLLVGLGDRPGLHLALRAVGARLVTVDSCERRLAALRAVLPAGPAGDLLLQGDPDDPGVVEAVAREAQGCDAVVFAEPADYEAARRSWIAYAPLVREGGLVAIVDRSQTFAMERRPFDVDRFAVDLERDVLVPAGVRVRRLGGAMTVHCYQQTAATRSALPPAWPRGFRPTVRSQRLGAIAGLAMHAWCGQVVLVEAAAGPFCVRRLERNRYETVLVAPDEAAARRCAAVWSDASAQLAEARDRLRANDIDGARHLAGEVAERHPWLAATLVESLAKAPWNRVLLLAQGTLLLFGDRGREGVALLRRALGMELVDGELMQTVATAYLHVLRDEAGARTLLREGKQRVRSRKVAQVCQQNLRGNVMWHYPQLVASVQSVVHVGAGRGALLDAWTMLEIPDQVHVEGDPDAYRELAARCASVRYGRVRAVPAMVGAAVGTAPLHRAPGRPRPSLLRPRGGDIAAATTATTTLDALLAAGALDERRCDLLFVEAEGAELHVLRGGIELLRHVDVVCVAIWLEPAYHDVPMPLDIQRFLREVHDGDGFGLRAFEPGADPACGTAVFRRLRARERRR